MESPRLGLLLNAEYPAADLVRLGELAEELGYANFFYVDVRFLRECYIGLASVAARTRRMMLGTGVTDPYSRHPAITAASMATLDELSAGRAMLGLGLGGAGFRELGINKAFPVTALRESIGVIRRLWRGEEVTFEGKTVTIASGKLQFTPMREAIPIYIATQGEQISRLAGELADGVLIANTATEAGIDFYLRRVAEGAAKAGRTLRDIDINLRWEICISPDETAATRAMRRRLAQRLINGYPNWGFLKQLGVSVTPEFEALAAQRNPALLDAATEALPMDVVNANMLAGNAERVASLIAPLLRPEVSGVTIRPHACPGTGVEEVMRSFVEDVMPLVAKRRMAGSAPSADVRKAG
jgi:5,10-methylenetetrahydromethanopterin reductase